MTTFRFALPLFVLLLGFDGAHAQHRKDAAEAVQEGSVANWLDYYKRDRKFDAGDQKPVPKPAQAPGPDAAVTPGPGK